MMGKLENRVALITGAASGIGRSIAELFADQDACVSVVDVDLDKAQNVVENIQNRGRKALAIYCDVTNQEQVHHTIQETFRTFGGLDILVNNAGVSPLRPFEEISLMEWNRVLAVNLTGPFLFCQAALPYIRKAKNKGRIINIGSLAGQIGGIAVGAHYTASKGGSMALTRQLAKLLAPNRATANNISPGTVDTSLTQAWPEETRAALIKQVPIGRLGKPEDIASLALFLASDEAGFITGATLNINGGLFIGS